MKKACVALLLALAATATAQERPTVTAQVNTVYVGADGKYEAAPDTALLQFNISVQEETAKAAYDRAAKAAQQIRQLLSSNGVDAQSAEIGFFSLQPVYDWRKPQRKLVAYRVNSSVSLKLKDFSKLGPITQRLAELDVTENQSINYTLENIDAAKIKAVEDAFQRAQAEAAALARAGKRTLGELVYSSVDTYERVPVLLEAGAGRVGAMRAEAAPAPPTAEFTPQKVVVTAHVNAMFALK